MPPTRIGMNRAIACAISWPAAAFRGIGAVHDERARDSRVDRADPARDRNDLGDLSDQVPHRDDRERQVLADCVEGRPECADPAEQVDPGADHSPVPAAQHFDRPGNAGRDNVEPFSEPSVLSSSGEPVPPARGPDRPHHHKERDRGREECQPPIMRACE